MDREGPVDPIILSATSRTTRPKRSRDSPASACRPRSSGRPRHRGIPATRVRRTYPWGETPPDRTLANLDQLSFGTAPVGAYPLNVSPIGCRGMIGDVWEWTSSDFGPWPGFQSFPYKEYSEVFFGPEYKVLRGGSWATRPARSATPSATGITPSAGRSSAASGAHAMSNHTTNAARTGRSSGPRRQLANARGGRRGALRAAEGALAQVFLRSARLRAVRGDHPAPRVLPHPHRARAAAGMDARADCASSAPARWSSWAPAARRRAASSSTPCAPPGTAELYVPIDVSATFLSLTAATLRREYPGLTVEPAVADIAEELNLPAALPHPALFAFLGSTIGNFYPPAAIRLLGRVRAAMSPSDRFLMGVDLRKDVARIEAAYNDSAGVTAEFNRNMLRVLNHELGADFDPLVFEHRAFYEPVAHRIEMHLVSTRAAAGDDPWIWRDRRCQGRIDPDGDQRQVRPRQRVRAVRRSRVPHRGMADRSQHAVRARDRGAGMIELTRAAVRADLAHECLRAAGRGAHAPPYRRGDGAHSG